MAIQTASVTSVRKTITNLSEAQQIRELNRQLDWIWRQLLGKLDSKAFSTEGLKQFVVVMQDALAKNVSDADVSIAAFLEALWTFVLSKIIITAFDYDSLKTMLSNALSISKDGSSIRITNLIATKDNIRYAVEDIESDLSDASERLDGLEDRLDSLSITNDMISQEVWDEIQRMIDA